MKTTKRFWCYWRENIATVREWYDIVFLFGAVGGIGISLAGQLINQATNPLLAFISHPIVEIISKLVGIGCFLWCLLVTPFRKHEKLAEKLQLHDAQIPILEIKTDPHQEERSRNGKCRIQICNKSQGVVAKDVIVKLLSTSLPVQRLISLLPEENDGNIIHPKVPSYFDFLSVERTDNGYILRVKLVGCEPPVIFDPKLITPCGQLPPKYEVYPLEIGAYMNQWPDSMVTKKFKLTFSGNLSEPAFALSEVSETK